MKSLISTCYIVEDQPNKEVIELPKTTHLTYDIFPNLELVLCS